VTHLPALRLDERVSIFVVLGAWAGSLVAVGWTAPKRREALVGLGAGLVAAVLSLLILGSKLTEKSAEAHATLTSATLKPNAVIIALGFLALGGVLGAGCGLVGGLMRGGARADAPEESQAPHESHPTLWLSRFALVALLIAAPLLLIGGLVTSTNAGMAVPDWPNTYGSNMFLYPLGPRAQVPQGADAKEIFLEHSHRLFGTLVGLTTLVLMLWAWRSAAATWLKALATCVFILVCVQGVLGGLRVAEDSRVLAMLHGVLGQLIFALLAALATYLSPAYGTWSAASPASGRRLRIFATAALHSTILQLLLGAAYRHFRHDHILYTHAAFALLVAIAATMGAFLAIQAGKSIDERAAHDDGGARLGEITGRAGVALVAVVAAQFILGWAAFLVGGRELEPRTFAQALLRTAHQANGAAMLALLTFVYVAARRMSPKRAGRDGPVTASAPAGAAGSPSLG
jgi:cytochrome c oxidase assembly protein subunit 15